MNNLNEILNFIKKNKNYSDLNLINNYLTNLNFTNYKGGAKEESDSTTQQSDSTTQQSDSTAQQSDSAAPLTQQSDSAVPVVQQPVLSPPVMQQPESPTPVVQQPESPPPVVQQPESPPPVVQQPESPPPVVQQPVISPPVVQQPESPPPVVQQPVISPPVVQQPESPPPVVQQPESPPPVVQQPESPPPVVQQPESSPPVVQQSINDTDEQNEQNCITTTLKNKFGSIIEQITCKNKNITLPNLLIRPTIINSEINTFTIKSGTILYHASKIRGFNPNEIKLGKDHLISFFTPNFKLASFKIKGCDLDELNSYIHTFEVVKDITKIFVKLPYTTGNININDLKNEFCTNKIYNGVGFFFPKNDIEIFNNALIDGNSLELEKLPNNDYYYSEFALCNPNEWLKYLVSHSCKSYRSLSPAFRMNS
jgi:hypothetical protein